MTLARNADILSIVDERKVIAKEEITAFDVVDIGSGRLLGSSVVALLYYAGYLTLKGSDDYTFTLDFPNTEVRVSFLASLVKSQTQGNVNPNPVVMEAVNAARDGDHGKIVGTINKYYRLFKYKDTEGHQEQWTKHLFKAFFGLLGIPVYTEPPGGKGRIDAVMITGTHNYVFEFKVDGKSADEAMEQIIDRHYDWFFTGDPKPLHLMGLDFRTEKRQIVAYTHMLYGSEDVEEFIVT